MVAVLNYNPKLWNLTVFEKLWIRQGFMNSKIIILKDQKIIFLDIKGGIQEMLIDLPHTHTLIKTGHNVSLLYRFQFILLGLTVICTIYRNAML